MNIGSWNLDKALDRVTFEKILSEFEREGYFPLVNRAKKEFYKELGIEDFWQSLVSSAASVVVQ